MLFLPYKFDSELRFLPLFTLIICISCIFIYWNQHTKDEAFFESVESFCYRELDESNLSFLQDVANESNTNPCYEIFNSIRMADDPASRLAELARNAKPIGLFPTQQDEFLYYHGRLESLYRIYDRKVTENLTDKLVYEPGEYDVVRMVTSTFSHGDVFHLVGNLIFFFVFAASLEVIMGWMGYLLFIGVTTIGTSLAYSYSVSGVENALPTLGLSGVVMAAVAGLGVILPRAKIRCFFWFILIVRTFRLPALVLAVWYVGWDVYNMNQADDVSNINYVAHVSGAGIGLLFGIYFRIMKKARIERASENTA